MRAIDGASHEMFLPTDARIREACKDCNDADGSLLAFVATDKLGEGLDFHLRCTRLVHFEQSPSPLRTIQREGRLFRILDDGKKRARSIQIAVPVFRGTSDEKLVDA